MKQLFNRKFSKKQKIIFSLCLFLIISATISGFLFFYQQKAEIKTEEITQEDKESVENKKEQKPVQKIYSKLSGVELEKIEEQNLPVIGVMVENSPAARPQSGMKDAEVVFEAIAEGGITRFLLLYQKNQPELIGPVRSIREYYIDWAGGFNASIAHVGGAAKALERMRDGQHRDMDQFFNAQTFWRSSDRYAPHNVYTNWQNISSLNSQNGWNSSNFKGFEFKDDSPEELSTASQISVNISGYLYDSTYSYNQDCNCYLKNQAGQPHLDREKGQISPKNLVILKMTMANDGYYNHYYTLGNGIATIFKDGKVEEATWHKPSENEPLILRNNQGEEIKFNRGQIWFSAIPQTGSITWQ